MFLNKISIKTRLVVLSLIPLAVILYFSIDRFVEARKHFNDAQKVETLVSFTSNVDAFVKAIRAEWYTNKKIMDAISYQKDHSELYNSLPEVRKAVDNTKEKLVTHILTNRLNQNGSASANSIQEILNQFENIEKARKIIDEKQFIIEDDIYPAAYHLYRISYDLFKVLDIVALEAIGDDVTYRSFHSYASLARVVENIQHLRDLVLVPMLEILYIQDYGDVCVLEEMDFNYEESFRAFASEPVVRVYYDDILDKELNKFFMRTVEMTRRSAQQINKRRDFGPEKWLESVAWRMEKMLGLQAMVLSELQTVSGKFKQKAEIELILSVVVGMVMLVLLIALSALIVMSMLNPLQNVVHVVDKVGNKKNLTRLANEDGKDEFSEVSHALNMLILCINDALSGIQNQSHQISRISSEVASAMSDTNDSSENQLKATDAVSVSMTEMVTTTQEVARMSEQTADAVKRAYDSSIEGLDHALTTKKLMAALNEKLDSTVIEVSDLNKEANVISSVLSVIQGIAEQTNLLALNAAIEAARAGESGRGFAVVSDEVRNLADLTQKSTGQIREQISALLAGASSSMQFMEDLKSKSSSAVEAVESSTENFEKLKAELDRVMGMTVQISTSAEEQSMVSEEIDRRVIAIKDSAGNVVDQTHLSFEATNSLTANVVALETLVDEYKLSENSN